MDNDYNEDNQLEEERSIKQQYLRENILEKGLNPQEFIEYCETLKKNGSNIDIWTLEELRQIINDFENINQENKNIDAPNEEDVKIFVPDTQSSDDNLIYWNHYDQKNEKKIVEKPIVVEEVKEPVYDENYLDKIISNIQNLEIKDPGFRRSQTTHVKTLVEEKIQVEPIIINKCEENKNSKTKVNEINPEGKQRTNTCAFNNTTNVSLKRYNEVVITKIESIKDGLFSKTWKFTITIEGLNLAVQRTVSDFKLLYDKLKKAFPSAIIELPETSNPGIPEKEYQKRLMKAYQE